MALCKGCNSMIGVIPVVGFCQNCVSNFAAMPPTQNADKPTSVVSSAASSSSEVAFVLNDDEEFSCNKGGRLTLSVDPALANGLLDHQKEGAKFIYRNCFGDCSCSDSTGQESEMNGCILAHFMGLGKSLTLITVLHTVMNHPMLVAPRGYIKRRPLFHMVLLVVPANTLTNWVNEVKKWTTDLENVLSTRNLGAVQKGYQDDMLQTWKECGGLLLLSDMHFLKVGDKIIENYQPDVLVLDEAHMMLKDASNKTFKKLQQIKTKRRICLTGTPLNNNLTEYYHMLEFIKPGVFGVKTVKQFEKKYRHPVERGLPSDATLKEKLTALEKQVELKNMLAPYVHRKGPEVLRASLPPIYDTLLELEPSIIQKKLMRSHRRQQGDGLLSKNFFSSYKALSPMLNHPGTLKVAKAGCGANVAWKKERDSWLERLKPNEYDNLHLARMSPKFVVLSHILAKAIAGGEKVLVYSQCLKTLDLLEEFLSFRDWKKPVGSLADHFPDLRLGGWKKNEDYVRLDGSVGSGKRGTLINDFNETDEVKAFLISSLAGGIGINLCSATVVVMMDNHFNPTVSNQCVSRSHRYGQQKPVRVFRLAIQNSLESKVYKRSVNKTGVAMRVLDGRYNENTCTFSSFELDDFLKNDTIVTCTFCGKRRILLPSQEIPDVFVCSTNEDLTRQSCRVEEEEKLKLTAIQDKAGNVKDGMLDHLLKLINRATSHATVVKGFAPVEASDDTDICCDDAIAMLRDEIAGKKTSVKTEEDVASDNHVVSKDRGSKRKFVEEMVATV